METPSHHRVIGLDLFRGFLIWMMIFLHNLDSFSGDLAAIESSAGIASSIGKFIGRWGVFFFIITGFSNSMSIYRKFETSDANAKMAFKPCSCQKYRSKDRSSSSLPYDSIIFIV